MSLSSTDYNKIHGMFLTGAATSATTSLETGSRETGGRIPVWLHYPYCEANAQQVGSIS